jgi:hypothetical protein
MSVGAGAHEKGWVTTGRATKGWATTGRATKGWATKGWATKGWATKGWARWPMRLAVLGGLAGCGGGEASSTGSAPAPTEAIAVPAVASGRGAAPVPKLPRPVAADPNPLGLPPRELDLAVGTRVFAVPEPMLRGARLGSTLVLASAKVVGRDVDALLVETREGQPYKLHAGYVVPFPSGKRRPGVGEPVIVEHAGVLRHGVFRARKKGRAVVRLFDAGGTADRSLDEDVVRRAEDGFRPGNFAAVRAGGELRHVLLVSPIESAEGAGAPRRWLALGHAGAATIVDEPALVAIPVRWNPKEGAAVLVESLGRMRPATVQAIDRPGLYTVKLERAGRPPTVGWGFIMPPPGEGGR